jgi:hypothetical protein
MAVSLWWSTKLSKKQIFRSEKWVIIQLFVQKNGLDSCFFVWKSVFLQRKFVWKNAEKKD